MYRTVDNNSLVSVAKAIGNCEVRFVNYKVTPQIDMRTREIIISDPKGTADTDDEVRAYIYHESGHAAFTSGFPNWVKNEMAQMCFNGLEDPRMERCVINKYFGTAPVFRSLYNKFFQLHCENFAQHPDCPTWQKKVMAIGFYCKGYDVPWISFTKEERALIDSAFMGDYDDCSRVSEQLYELWKDEYEQEKDERRQQLKVQKLVKGSPSNGESGEGESSGEIGEASGISSGSKPKSEQGPEEKEGENKEGEKGENKEDSSHNDGEDEKAAQREQNGSDKSEKDGKSENSGEENKKSKDTKADKNSGNNKNKESGNTIPDSELFQDNDMVQSLEDYLKDAIEAKYTDTDFTEVPDIFRVTDYRTEATTVRERTSNVRGTREMVDKHARMFCEIQNSIMAKMKAKTTRYVKKGMLDGANLANVYTSDRLFYTKTVTKTDRTAVSIVIDNSGSMHGGKILNSIYTAVMIGKCLDSLHINYEIVLQDDVFYVGEKGCEGALETKLCFVKEFGKPSIDPATLGKMYKAAVELSFTGCNFSNSEAIFLAKNRLDKVNAKRKILLMITDGAAELSWISTRTLVPATIKRIEEMRDASIETYAIGVDVKRDVFEEIYKHCNDHINIQTSGDCGKIVEQVLPLFKGIILKYT